MYTIKIDGVVFYDPIIAERGYVVLDPVLVKELNSADSLTFRVPSSHPRLDLIVPLKSTVTVEEDGNIIFYGRILTVGKDFYNFREIVCEGAFAFLNDVILRPYTYKGNVSDYVTGLISRYNLHAAANRQITAGTVNVSGGTIQRANINYPTVLSEVNEKLIGSSLGGYVKVYESSGVLLLDYTTDSGIIDNTQSIQFGVNLLDLMVENNAEETYSVIIPLGAVDDTIPDPSNYPSGWATATGKRLTIEQATLNPSHYDYISDIQPNSYGWIERAVSWDDVTNADNLYDKGDALLDTQGIYALQTVTTSAVDMKLFGKSASSLVLGNKYKLVSYPHGITNTDGTNIFPLVREEIKLADPSQSKYTFGKTEKTLTGGLK